MKKFIFTILSVAVFFIGIGGLIDGAKANFKSDARALELIGQARQAIGGDAAINRVRSMTIIANATETFDVDGVTRSDAGSLEINLELPGKFSKKLQIGNPDTANGGDDKKQVNVIVMRQPGDNAEFKTETGDTVKSDGKKKVIITEENPTGDANGRKKIIIVKPDGAPGGADANDNRVVVDRKIRVAGDANEMRGGEMFRTVFALLLTAPEGTDASYAYAGDSSVDGFACNVVEVRRAGSTFKLFLDQNTHLPRMISFQDLKPFVFNINKDSAGGSDDKDVKVVVRQMDGEMSGGETAEFQIKYSDYRTVDGIKLPFQWTQTVGGKPGEMIDVTSYQINPANIGEKFADQK